MHVIELMNRPDIRNTGLTVSAKLNSKIHEKGQQFTDKGTKLLNVRAERMHYSLQLVHDMTSDSRSASRGPFRKGSRQFTPRESLLAI